MLVFAGIIGLAGLAIVVTEAQSERLAMTLAIRNMRTGLQLAMAEKILRGEENQIPDLALRNPLEFLGGPNPGQGGVWGNWQFDEPNHELVYRPMIALAFDGNSELRWHIVGVAGQGGRVTGLRLEEALQRLPRRRGKSGS